jgi:hypothetical protein
MWTNANSHTLNIDRFARFVGLLSPRMGTGIGAVQTRCFTARGGARACFGVASWLFALAACSAEPSDLFSEVRTVAPTPAPAPTAAAPDTGGGQPTPLGSSEMGPATPSIRPPAAPAPVSGSAATDDAATDSAATDADAGPPDPGPPDPGPPDPGPPSGDEGVVPTPPARPPAGVVFGDASQACTLPASPAGNTTLFSGAREGDGCRINLDEPYGTFWYSYQDTDAEPRVFQGVQAPGCFEDRCSLRVQGPIAGAPPFTLFGAGVGFPLAVGDAQFDASGFSGIQYWARGIIQGTRDAGNTPGSQTLLLKVASSTNRSGDDFARFCRIDVANWTLCRQEFSELERDGYVADPNPATDTLELSQLVRIEFEFPLHRDAAGAIPVPVQFDVQLASISFF